MNKIYCLDTNDERIKIIKKILLEEGYACYDYPEKFDYHNDDEINYVFSPSSIIKKENILIGSNVFYFSMDEQLKRELIKTNNLYSVMKDEYYVNENSYLTAEGTLAHIIFNTDKALNDCNILCLGYGHLGKAIVKILNQLNIKITVSDRMKSKLITPKNNGNKILSLKEANEMLNEFDVIINTVPAKIFSQPINLKKDVFIIELASKIYPFDYEKLSETNYIIAKALPSKTSKYSAAVLLLSVIQNIKKT